MSKKKPTSSKKDFSFDQGPSNISRAGATQIWGEILGSIVVVKLVLPVIRPYAV